MHLQNMDVELRTGKREAERDMWEQKNNELQARDDVTDDTPPPSNSTPNELPASDGVTDDATDDAAILLNHLTI